MLVAARSLLSLFVLKQAGQMFSFYRWSPSVTPVENICQWYYSQIHLLGIAKHSVAFRMHGFVVYVLI